MTKKHTLILSALSIAALLVLCLWVFLYIKGTSIKAEALAVESDIAAKRNDETYLASVHNALKNSKADIASIDARFINKDGIPAFIDLLESKISHAGIKADVGSIDIATDANGSEVLRLHITGTGSWENVLSFITALESLPTASKAESVTFQKTNDTDVKNTTWSFGVDFIQYLSNKK